MEIVGLHVTTLSPIWKNFSRHERVTRSPYFAGRSACTLIQPFGSSKQPARKTFVHARKTFIHLWYSLLIYREFHLTNCKDTLGDIFISLEMRRFFKEFAIFSGGQNFGFQNKIRRIIFDVFLSIVTSSIHHLHDGLLI